MTKKLISLLLALTMVFACAVPVVALTNTAATTQQVALANAPTDNDGMTVYLSIQSDKIGDYYMTRYNYPVVLSASDYSNNVCFVGDVLRKAATTYSWLTFYTTDDYGNLVSLPNGPTDNVYGISDSNVNSGNTVFTPVTSINYQNGWRFRINGKYPLLNSADYPASGPDFDPTYDYPVGATIETAYVQDGDLIDLYFGHTVSSSLGTRKIIADGVGYDSTNHILGILLYESHDYYTEGSRLYDPGDDRDPYYVPYWTWTITSYAQMTSTSYSIYVSLDGATAVKGTFNSGYLTIPCASLTSGTHTVSIVPTFKTYTRNSIKYGIPYATGYDFQFNY